VSIANRRYFKWIARISHSLSPARIRNDSRWFAAADQAEKNRLVKNVLLEKEPYGIALAVKGRVNSRSKRENEVL